MFMLSSLMFKLSYQLSPSTPIRDLPPGSLPYMLFFFFSVNLLVRSSKLHIIISWSFSFSPPSFNIIFIVIF